MKVIDFINELNRIGYNKDTELTFGCINKDNGDWFDLKPYPNPDTKSAFTFGEELTGETYNNDEINFDLDVDGCKDYLQQKVEAAVYDFVDDLDRVIQKHCG